MNHFSQTAFSVRLEWGTAAIQQLGMHADCIVVVDVMSFSTCVSIATERGTEVFPYPRSDETARAFGQQNGAQIANSDRCGSGGLSLSPASLLRVQEGLRFVLPSPNGSACAFLAKDLGKAVYCGCFRNLSATAIACSRFGTVLVVPCGERWPDGSLRPCVEDYLAAGGIVSKLGRKDASPEARAAALAFEHLGDQRDAVLRSCGSAMELIERGFAADVALCIDDDASGHACRLDGERFVAERPV